MDKIERRRERRNKKRHWEREIMVRGSYRPLVKKSTRGHVIIIILYLVFIIMYNHRCATKRYVIVRHKIINIKYFYRITEYKVISLY